MLALILWRVEMILWRGEMILSSYFPSSSYLQGISSNVYSVSSLAPLFSKISCTISSLTPSYSIFLISSCFHSSWDLQETHFNVYLTSYFVLPSLMNSKIHSSLIILIYEHFNSSWFIPKTNFRFYWASYFILSLERNSIILHQLWV